MVLLSIAARAVLAGLERVRSEKEKLVDENAELTRASMISGKEINALPSSTTIEETVDLRGVSISETPLRDLG